MCDIPSEPCMSPSNSGFVLFCTEKLRKTSCLVEDAQRHDVSLNQVLNLKLRLWQLSVDLDRVLVRAAQQKAPVLFSPSSIGTKRQRLFDCQEEKEAAHADPAARPAQSSQRKHRRIEYSEEKGLRMFARKLQRERDKILRCKTLQMDYQPDLYLQWFWTVVHYCKTHNTQAMPVVVLREELGHIRYANLCASYIGARGVRWNNHGSKHLFKEDGVTIAVRPEVMEIVANTEDLFLSALFGDDKETRKQPQ